MRQLDSDSKASFHAEKSEDTNRRWYRLEEREMWEALPRHSTCTYHSSFALASPLLKRITHLPPLAFDGSFSSGERPERITYILNVEYGSFKIFEILLSASLKLFQNSYVKAGMGVIGLWHGKSSVLMCEDWYRERLKRKSSRIKYLHRWTRPKILRTRHAYEVEFLSLKNKSANASSNSKTSRMQELSNLIIWLTSPSFRSILNIKRPRVFLRWLLLCGKTGRHGYRRCYWVHKGELTSLIMIRFQLAQSASSANGRRFKSQVRPHPTRTSVSLPL